jgi:hypothetical protein
VILGDVVLDFYTYGKIDTSGCVFVALFTHELIPHAVEQLGFSRDRRCGLAEWCENEEQLELQPAFPAAGVLQVVGDHLGGMPDEGVT